MTPKSHKKTLKKDVRHGTSCTPFVPLLLFNIPCFDFFFELRVKQIKLNQLIVPPV